MVNESSLVGFMVQPISDKILEPLDLAKVAFTDQDTVSNPPFISIAVRTQDAPDRASTVSLLTVVVIDAPLLCLNVTEVPFTQGADVLLFPQKRITYKRKVDSLDSCVATNSVTFGHRYPYVKGHWFILRRH